MNGKLNLQLFAESEAPNLTAEELKAQLTAANAQIAKLTNKADTLASENAAKTKQLRGYLNEEEAEEQARKEAEAERDKQFKAMQRELTIMSSVNTYMMFWKCQKILLCNTRKHELMEIPKKKRKFFADTCKCLRHP